MDSLTGSLRDTPLTLEEKQRPIAFAPMLDRLSQAKAEAATGLETARAGVAGETWGLPPRPGRPFQQITTLYLHRGTGGTATAWAKIEFPPGSGLFDPIFQGLAIALMAGEIASLALSRMTVPIVYFVVNRKRKLA